MAIETALSELTAAVAKLTVVTENLLELREKAIETVKTTAAPAAKAEKPAAAAKKTETAAAPADPAPSDDAAYEEAKGLVAQYTKGSDRPEEVEARKGKIKFLLRHEKLVKPELAGETTKYSVTDVQVDKVAQLVKNLNKLIADGDITTPAPAASAEDDLL